MTHKRVSSFKYALEGIFVALKEEPNLKFHFFAAVSVFLAGLYFNVSSLEWAILIITIGLVISVEMVNTAIEEIVNSFTEDSHPGAKKAKDVAAGAVLVVSFISILIGLLIFLPYFY